MTDKTIKAIGTGTMWIEIDQLIDEDNWKPAIRITASIVLLVLVGLIFMACLMA